ncbi:MAG: PD40 domain-containing protein [Planctomycetes bacterium]|nr:PD40 domain-containing protein [Planctomycetota bacterium]
MTDFEDRLAELRPVRAPEALWDRIRSGKLAERRLPSIRKDALALAAAALLLATLYVLLLPSPEAAPAALPQGNPEELMAQLKGLRHKIVTEGNRDGNWELWLMNADGSNVVNLTKTPDVDELYPKVSPDGTKIVFCADEGKGEEKVRNLYVMDLDGGKRVKIADNSREPCWSGDGKKIAFLRGELDKFTYSDFATKGIFMYDLASGQVRQHPNKKIEHLYTLNWTPDGKWFVATVHGGMGFKHGILALEAEGEGVYDLNLGGCRPDLSPDGKQIAWGHWDYAVGVADLDFSGSVPKATNVHNVVESKDPLETYHVDWSPDGKYVAFSYGSKVKGKSLKGLLPEFPGVEAPGWNCSVADVSKKNTFVQITTDGKSWKEPDWVFVK